MKQIFTSVLMLAALAFNAQTTISNPGFENWGGNPSPGVSTEPTGWFSNKSGTGLASSGPQTCFQETTPALIHGGSYSARIVTTYYIIAVVNGNVTTGIVNAPSSNKAQGYLSTINGTDIRRMNFTGRPDSLTGWYQYTQATSGTNPTQEQGKVRAILHKGHYYDPETPVSGNHPDSSMNKIGDALFLTAMSNNTTWKRFSVPFTYTSAATPSYIMINITSSANQLTSAPGSSGVGSKLWIDDLAPVYNPVTTGINELQNAGNMKAFCYEKTFYVDFVARNAGESNLSIYDISGKLITEQKVDNSKLNSVDMSQQPTGLYLYTITGAGYQKSGKFIVD